MEQALGTTRNKKYRAKSAKFERYNINKRLGNLIGRCFEMPYVSFCHPLATS